MKIIQLISISLYLYYIKCSVPFLNLLVENDTIKNNKSTIFIYGHLNPDTDSIISSIVLADYQQKIDHRNNVISCRLGKLNKETKYALNYFNVESPVLITDLSGADKVILVDHNSPSQSIDSEYANIIGIIDHHSISNFTFMKPIQIITKPVGSTCTILYELYRKNNISISKEIAGLIISAIISDTLLFKSPSTTQKDIDAVIFLSEYIKIDYKEYGYNMLMAGTDISDLSEYDIINIDSKAYNINGYLVQIALVNSVNANEVLKRKKKLLEEIDNFIKKKKINLFIFIILDIINIDSTLLVRGNIIKSVEVAFGVKIHDDEVFLKGIKKKKKQIYPKISKVINELPKYVNSYDIINIKSILLLFLSFLNFF